MHAGKERIARSGFTRPLHLITCRLILYFIMLVSLPVFAQQTQLNFKHVDIPKYGGIIFDGTIDDQGFLWLCVVEGVYQYNGHEFRLFTNIPGDTTSLTFGRPTHAHYGGNQDVWIGTMYGGVSRLDLTTYKFRSFRHSRINAKTLGGNNIGGIYVENQHVTWVGSNDFCLNRIDMETGFVERYYPETEKEDRRFSNYLGKIAPDPTNTDLLWVGSPHGVYRFEKSTGSFRLFRFLAYNRNYKPHPVGLHVDDDGIVWATSIDGYVRIDPDTDSIHHFRISDEAWDVSKGWMSEDIQQFSEEEIIILSNRMGLIIHNRHSGAWHLINDDPDLGRAAVFYLRDSAGSHWVGARDLLHAAPRGNTSTFVSLRSFPGYNWARSILPVEGTNAMYISTEAGAGLFFVDQPSGHVKAFTYKLDENYRTDVHMRDMAWGADSTIFIASDGGLLHFDPNTEKFNRIIISRADWGDVNAVCLCDERLWFADQKGNLYGILPGTHRPLAYDSLYIAARVTDLHCANGYLWIGTEASLGRYDMHGTTPDFFLPDVHISQILREQDTLWVSSIGQGLFQMDINNAIIYKQHFNEMSRGTNYIYHFTRARNGHLWLNTDGGATSYDPRSGTFVNYIEMSLGQRSPIVQLPNDVLVTGAFNSFRFFRAEDYTQRGVLPKPYFTKINIANREETYDKAPNLIRHIRLRPHEQELVIEFSAINHNTISATDYAYRVSGIEDEWRNLGHQQYVTLDNLKPGTYFFELKATNAYGGISEEIKTLEITVEPPIHQRWWFLLLTGVSAVAFGWILYTHFRKRNLEKLHTRTVAYFANSRYAENSVDEILWDVARNVISRLRYEDCVIYLMDADAQTLVQKAAYGEKNPQGREIVNPLRIPVGTGIVGHAARDQKPVLVADVSRDPRYIVDMEAKGSELAVPIIHQGVTIGVIDSEHSRKGYFSEADADVLGKIAKDCAHKIANAQAAEEIKKREVELLNVQKEIAESKLTALQAQMNPHFIFNSLNSINWYILKNKPAEASLYLTKFSKLVRLILDNSKNLTIPLDKELESLRLYLDLESMRFENTFDYEIHTDESIDQEEVLIPPLILQPFVENAIWHGLMPKENKGHLAIQIYPENGHLKCIVQDDGIGRRASHRMKSDTTPQHASKGMKLTTDRIRLLHKNYLREDMIRIIDLVDSRGEAGGTRVEVVLPYG